MRLKKYLLYFAYNGNRFRGVQKNRLLGCNDNSITKFLETSLLSLSPLNTPVVYNASRTDSGVHAICSACHTELCLPPLRGRGRTTTDENYITTRLNSFFLDSCIDIRIRKTQEVPLYFHSRHLAIKRTYLYRVAHFLPSRETKYINRSLPLPELHKCHLICGEFDPEAAKAACRSLIGTHDFKYFTKEAKNEKKEIKTVKTIDEFTLAPGEPLMNPKFDERYDNLQFWDFVVSSRNFLRNQVRRMVTLAIGVGRKDFSLKYVEAVLTDPSKKWPPNLNLVRPEGLYLLNIQYPPEAFLEESYADYPKKLIV